MKKNLLSVMFIIMLICSGCGKATDSIDTEVSVKEFTDSETTVMEAQAETLRKESDQELEVSNHSEEETSETEEVFETIEESEVPEKTEASKIIEESEVPEKMEASKIIMESEMPEKMEASKIIEESEVPEKIEATKSFEESAAVEETSSAPTPHTCTWDSGKVTTNATCNSEGTKMYTCTGCGTTRTEGIAKTTHNYITESIPATCTEAGRIKTYCSICGDVQSEVAGEAAKGHIAGAKAYWQGQGPTCLSTAYYNICCSTCGERLESGTDPALPCTEVATVIYPETCCSDGVVSIDCSVCGCHLRNEHIEPNDNHDWEKTEFNHFNEETLEWEKIPGERCTVCERQRY